MPQPKDKDWLKGCKNKTPIYGVYKRLTSKQGTESERLEKDISCKQRPKERRIDFEIKAMKRDNEGHYIMIKGSIQGEDITIVIIYAPNIGAPQYVRQMLISVKGEINSNIIIVGDFNTPLISMDRSTKQKISKETQTSNDTMDQLDLIDIYRTFHPKTINFTFFKVHMEHSPG